MEYLSNEFQLYKKRIIQDYIETYDLQKGIAKELRAKEQNQKIINQRKAEYRKREGEGSELLINTFGCFIGLSGKGITVKQQGKIIAQRPIGSLSHITIASKGVTLSSNLIDYYMANKISIDFFNSSGVHNGSILSTKYIENTLWNKQALCGTEKRMKLACSIIGAKLNPFDSIIHVRQVGKPTFVYDVVEMFRSQVVDRVVITLIQKGHHLKADKGMLDQESKRLLAKSILERLQRYEKYRGTEMKMEEIIRMQAKEIALWIETGKIYKPYTAKW